jgi:hypothetical protein
MTTEDIDEVKENTQEEKEKKTEEVVKIPSSEFMGNQKKILK